MDLIKHGTVELIDTLNTGKNVTEHNFTAESSNQSYAKCIDSSSTSTEENINAPVKKIRAKRGNYAPRTLYLKTFFSKLSVTS